MTFDPAKPVADKTACGKLAVKNFRKRSRRSDGGGDFIDYPFAVDVIEGSQIVWSMSVTAKGTQYTRGAGYQLVNVPEPAGVDWGQAIQTDGGAPLVYVGPIPKDRFGNTHVSYDPDSELFLRSTDDGKRDGTSSRIINVPTPPRVLTVEIAGATHPEREGSYLAVKSKDGGITLDPILSANLLPIRMMYDLSPNAFEYAIDDGWKFGPWQSVELKLGE